MTRGRPPVFEVRGLRRCTRCAASTRTSDPGESVVVFPSVELRLG